MMFRIVLIFKKAGKYSAERELICLGTKVNYISTMLLALPGKIFLQEFTPPKNPFFYFMRSGSM